MSFGLGLGIGIGIGLTSQYVVIAAFNASDGVGTDTDSGVRLWQPKDDSAVTEQWRSTEGITQASNLVSAWVGQKSARSFGASGSVKPTWAATDANFDSRPSLGLSGGGAQWMQATGFTESQPRGYFAIFRPASVTAGALIDSANGAARNDVFYVAGPHLALYAGSQVNVDVALSANAVYAGTFVFNGASSYGRANGTQSANVNANTQGINGLNLGEPAPGGAGSFNGTLTEIHTFTGAPSAALVAKFEAYAKLRYPTALTF